MTRKWVIAASVGVAAVAVAVAAAVFQPWLLFVNVEVDEALPIVEPTGGSPTPSPSVTPTVEPAVPVQLSGGELISHEHDTSGTVRIIENPDGSRVLTLENLATSNGPDVHVWLAEAPVVPGFDGWFLADDAGYIDLGPIKGNLGNQVYEIPADVDVSRYPSVYLWCEQFAVSFGAASVV